MALSRSACLLGTDLGRGIAFRPKMEQVWVGSITLGTLIVLILNRFAAD